jgi:anti-anti-sigma factor
LVESSAPDLLSAVIDTTRDTVTVRLIGEIDISSAHILSSSLDEIAGLHPDKVLIDATGVTFMDSSGLHALIEGKRSLHESGASIALVPSEQVKRLLELVFPEHLFAFRCETIDEALTALGSQAATP